RYDAIDDLAEFARWHALLPACWPPLPYSIEGQAIHSRAYSPLQVRGLSEGNADAIDPVIVNGYTPLDLGQST
ncbi:MAG: hypothetical protein RLW42_08110, partial [Gammaproteobacteria bacterium]